jgi:hypothetical protein
LDIGEEAAHTGAVEDRRKVVMAGIAGGVTVLLFGGIGIAALGGGSNDEVRIRPASDEATETTTTTEATTTTSEASSVTAAPAAPAERTIDERVQNHEERITDLEESTTTVAPTTTMPAPTTTNPAPPPTVANY